MSAHNRDNLLETTLEIMKYLKKTPADIEFIGSTESGLCCTWEVFLLIADKEFDQTGEDWNACVAEDLKIIFTDKRVMWIESMDDHGEHTIGWRFSPSVDIPAPRTPLYAVIGPTKQPYVPVTLIDLNKKEDTL